MLRLCLLLVALAAVSVSAQPSDSYWFRSPIMDGSEVRTGSLPARALIGDPPTREGGAYVHGVAPVDVPPGRRLYALMLADGFEPQMLFEKDGEEVEVSRSPAPDGGPTYVAFHNQSNQTRRIQIVASSVAPEMAGDFRVEYRLQREGEEHEMWRHVASRIDGADSRKLTDGESRHRRAEGYLLPLREGQQLHVQAWSAAFRPALTLMGPSGYIGHVEAEIGAAPATDFTYDVEVAGSYTVLVSSAGGDEDTGEFMARWTVRTK